MVPERGIPTTMSGSSIGMDSISGYRWSSSVSDNRLRSSRTTRCRSDPRVSWRSPWSASIAATWTCRRSTKPCVSSRSAPGRPACSIASASIRSMSRSTGLASVNSRI
ncbi:hypothetical protein ACYJ3W_15885 [Mycobacterium avium subsp. paratuberculosis]|uniref:hypothetical protein n=1 Tax=Mycobacterium avium TaxID=1764 RepID=UPI0020C77D13|nr:hypothetical protein [Mycobacterium avium]UYB88773.1 hypothetical protein OBK31_01460 [Mycobacterium avium subsp. paratuberculosis K-10]